LAQKGEHEMKFNRLIFLLCVFAILLLFGVSNVSAVPFNASYDLDPVAFKLFNFNSGTGAITGLAFDGSQKTPKYSINKKNQGSTITVDPFSFPSPNDPLSMSASYSFSGFNFIFDPDGKSGSAFGDDYFSISKLVMDAEVEYKNQNSKFKLKDGTLKLFGTNNSDPSIEFLLTADFKSDGTNPVGKNQNLGLKFPGDVTLQIGQNLTPGNTSPVPEPTTMLLVGAGLVGLAGLGRKKFKKA
jgi:hypothetical protein